MDILDYLSHLGEAEQAWARGVIEDIEEQALRDMQVRAQSVVCMRKKALLAWWLKTYSRGE